MLYSRGYYSRSQYSFCFPRFVYCFFICLGLNGPGWGCPLTGLRLSSDLNLSQLLTSLPGTRRDDVGGGRIFPEDSGVCRITFLLRQTITDPKLLRAMIRVLGSTGVASRTGCSAVISPWLPPNHTNFSLHHRMLTRRNKVSLDTHSLFKHHACVFKFHSDLSRWL